MFKFRVGSIPVEVHASHVLIAAVLAWTILPVTVGYEGWPGTVLSDANHPSRGSTQLIALLLWVGMISVSVLVHELGHAVVSKWFGYKPTIQLVGMGGLTQPNAPGPIPWHKDVALTLAGPAAGLGLGGAAWALKAALGDGAADPAKYVLGGLFAANLFWGALNLMPVIPLDGGRVSQAILTRIFGRQGFLLAHLGSLIIAGGLALLGAYARQIFVAIIFGMYAFQALTQVLAYLKGETPQGAAGHPLVKELDAAESHYRDGRLADAAEAARRVLNGQAPLGLRSRAHHLLGWVALKVGRGRLALDHFSQVQGIAVETQGLATAFSLVGDEPKALQLWEQVLKAGNDPVALGEYAGCLVRLDREADARRLPGVNMGDAFAAAERILFLRGEFLPAARMAEAAFTEAPSPEQAYDAACAYARGGDAENALRLLRLAAQNGFDQPDVARADEDLESLHGLPEFVAWVNDLPPPKPVFVTKQ